MAQTVKNLPAMWEIQVQSLGWEDTLEKGMATHTSILGASLMAQMVKTLSAVWVTWVQSLGQKDSLEKGIEHVFMCLLAICISTLEKCLLKPLPILRAEYIAVYIFWIPDSYDICNIPYYICIYIYIYSLIPVYIYIYIYIVLYQ